MPGADTPTLPAAVLAGAVAQTPDAVVIVDAAGVVRYWNKGAERIFGYQEHEMLGSTLDPIIPERLRHRHHEGFRTAMARGWSRYGNDDLLAVPARHADGRTVSIEFSVALLATDDGPVGHVAAIMRDVTARRAREQELRRQIEALEESRSTP
ncbi:MAG: PAS domain S-box protein [Acidimicrobiales bacterium]